MSTRQKFAIASLVPLGLVALALYVLLMAVGPRGVAGNFGYDADPAGAKAFASEAGSFREVAAEAVERAQQRDVFLYRYVYKAHEQAYGRPWQCWDQGDAGTCVSMAFGLGCYTAACVDAIEGGAGKPPPVCATEPIYGGARTAGVSRSTHTGGDGATGFGAARWISGACPQRPEIGGILYRQVYGEYDLSKYSISLSRAWGRTGVPVELARLAYKSRATAVANVSTWEELVASIERGSPVVLASNVGYGRWDNRMPVRDSDAFLERGKPWGHAMLVWAIRHKNPDGSGREGGLIQNSWSGRWCEGPKWPHDQPDGSFWASRENITAALEQGDCWAIGGVTTGLSWRELDHGSWMEGGDEIR